MTTIKRFLVGGSVRDLVRHLIENNQPIRFNGNIKDIATKIGIKDFDWVVIGETPKSMQKKGFISVGKSFPVFLDKNKEEHALARKEIKTGKGHQKFDFVTDNVTLEEDAKRRDFTFNALMLSEKGEIIDFFNGIDDIKNGVIRHIGEAFKEDPLRPLRAAQFASRFGFEVAPETIEISKTLKDEIPFISKERIFIELKKGLAGKKPSAFFRTLKDMELLDITFPHIHAMIGKEQRIDFHSEGDVFEHSMLVLDTVSTMTKDIKVRFAALFHDIGKPVVFDKTGTFHGHDGFDIVKPLFDEIQKDFKEAKEFNKIALVGALFHHTIHRFDEMSVKGIKKHFSNKHFPKKEADFEKLLMIAQADNLGRIVNQTGKKLTKKEIDFVLNGGVIEGVSIPAEDNFDKIRFVFKEFNKPFIIPEDIKKDKNKVIQFISKERSFRIKNALKNM